MAMEHTIPERTFEFYAHVGSAISWHTRSTPVVMRRVSSAVDAAVRRIIAVVLWLRRPGRLRRLRRSSAADKLAWLHAWPALGSIVREDREKM
jgi:hypothetical protein